MFRSDPEVSPPNSITARKKITPETSGGNSTNVYTGRPRLEVQPLTLLYTVFHEQGTPFLYLLLKNGTPFT